MVLIASLFHFSDTCVKCWCILPENNTESVLIIHGAEEWPRRTRMASGLG